MFRVRILVLFVISWIAYGKRPNVFFLLTDDQDVMLGGIERMKHLKSLIGEKGVTFEKAFSHTPICCPSRSSFLTGRYLHNSKTFQNSVKEGCGNETWRDEPETRTYAVHAKKFGYRTSYSGKYLNTYAMPGSVESCNNLNDASCFTHIPPGWDDWFGLQGNSAYYNKSISDNGVQVYHSDSENDYLPDVFFARTKSFLQNHLENHTDSPFLAVLATPSCHGPFTPAPKYVNKFSNLRAPRTPNYNHSNEDKNWLMRQLSPLDEDLEIEIDTIHNNRLATLLSVDDYIEEIVNMLSEANELENTFFLYVVFERDLFSSSLTLSTHSYHLHNHSNVMKNLTRASRSNTGTPRITASSLDSIVLRMTRDICTNTIFEFQ